MNVITNDRQLGVLEEYATLKLQLAAILRSLLHHAEQRKDDLAVGDCRRLLARVAEDRFNLAVVGQFSRGKSSLMNALLGAEKLPTGILPLTSVITTVAYGESERVLLQREGWSFPQEIRLDQLQKYVTQRGNPDNQKRVTLAEIQFPHEMLRLGVHFIDTPGIASAIRANTRTTRQYLPEIDAAILVTSFESPFAETEVSFLREVSEHVRTVFIAVNKQDLVPVSERTQVLDAIRNDLRTAFGAQFDVFGVSARDALLAKQRGAPAELEASGLPALEAALTKFLRTQKARELLLRAADRAESVARQQVISVRISERARTPAESESFDRRLRRILSGLDHERHTVIQRLLNRLRLEFLRRCEEAIRIWDAASEASLMVEWRRWLLHDGDIAGAAFQQFLRDLSQKFFSEWESRNRQTIDTAFAELAQAEGPALEDLVTRICRISADVLAEELPAGRLLSRPIETPPLAFRAISVPVEEFQLPWWCDLIPSRRLRELMYPYWRKRMADFVRLYEHAVVAIVETSIDDWVADIERQLTGRIENVKSHIENLIRVKVDTPRLSEVQDIQDRIESFRETVQQMGTGDDRAPMTLRSETSPNRCSALERCAICSRLERTLWNFFAHFQYELSINENRQRQHALRSGFCPLHTWQYETISSPQGVCAGYPEVLTGFADGLRKLAEDGSSVQLMDDGLRSMLPKASSCEACDLLASDERAAAEQVARNISQRDGQRPPLCSYHLHSVLAANPELDAAKRLILEEAGVFDYLADEMQNYVLKHTAVRHNLTTKSESQAAVVGLSRLVGSQRIAGPWRID